MATVTSTSKVPVREKSTIKPPRPVIPTDASKPAKPAKSSKPARSMTHPLRDPKANAAKRRVKQGEPFDPEDLSRRLNAHLVEQRLKAEKRREARAMKAAAAQGNSIYHHVPKVAASAFERTTTPEVMRQIHKLAQPAAKAHLELLSIDDPLPGQPSTSLKRTQALDQAMIERDLLRHRNQFQWDHAMEEAAEADLCREVYKPPQRTFVNEFAHLIGRPKKDAARPLSTGDVISEEEELPPTKTKPKPTQAHDFTDRNNWTQRDDEMEAKRKKERTTPTIKKVQSSWILMGKRSPKPDKDEAVAGIGISGSPPSDSKSGRSSFLARFKRHPS